MIGWLGPDDGIVAWFANPMILFAWILMVFRPLRWVAFGTALVALILALSFLLNTEVTKDEAGHIEDITGYAVGYWLWLASMVVAILGSVVIIRLKPVLPSRATSLPR